MSVEQGLNLIPLEYIYARSDPESAGVVLASEFSACSSLLNGAVRINPFDVAKTASAMEQAITMKEAERLAETACLAMMLTEYIECNNSLVI